MDNEKEILHFENVGIKEENIKDPLIVSFFLPFRPGSRDKTYYLSIASDKWLGVDTLEGINLEEIKISTD